MSVERLYLHTIFERLWHALHLILFATLALSGANLHWPEAFSTFGGMRAAIVVHDAAAIGLVADFAVWLPYLFLSGRFRHYLPGRRDLVSGVVRQGRFYLFDLFLGRPHPFPVTEKEKFNPLQKWAYVGVMFGLIPALIGTGALLWFPGFLGLVGAADGVRLVAVAHTALAFAGAAFFASHVYLSTLGFSPLDALRSMLTGWAREHGR